MKKKLFLIVALVVCVLSSAFAQANITIAVPAPKTMNIGDGNEWIPLFIQGVITSNFQQYSGMKVVDRQNADMVKAEQRLSEGAEFNEKTAIELGKMTSARLIITGNITGKSSSYALMFSITDVETGETKASATVPNCLFSALENGEAANRISYDLMTGYGVKLSADAKAKLTTAPGVMSAETAAQASVAKGIVAEKNGSNIEALTYYIQAKKNDKNFSEATSRASAMSTAVASGNFGAKAKNLIKMRNDWDKLLTEAAELIKSNPPTFELLYYSDVTPGEIDYDKGRMVLSVSAPLLRQNNEKATQENIKLVNELNDALAKIPESKDWGEKINNFPREYYENDSSIYAFDINFLDADKKKIGTKRVCFGVDYGWYSGRLKYQNGWKLSIEQRRPEHYSEKIAQKFINIYVDVNDADTDTIYVSVENPMKYNSYYYSYNKEGNQVTVANQVTVIKEVKKEPMTRNMREQSGYYHTLGGGSLTGSGINFTYINTDTERLMGVALYDDIALNTWLFLDVGYNIFLTKDDLDTYQPQAIEPYVGVGLNKRIHIGSWHPALYYLFDVGLLLKDFSLTEDFTPSLKHSFGMVLPFICGEGNFDIGLNACYSLIMYPTISTKHMSSFSIGLRCTGPRLSFLTPSLRVLVPFVWPLFTVAE